MISNQARFRREQITFAGKSTAWTRTAESGNGLTFHFCPTCGSTVYWEGQASPVTSPLPSAPLPTQIFPGPRSRYGKSPDIPRSLSRPTRQPSACQSRSEAASPGAEASPLVIEFESRKMRESCLCPTE